MVVQYKYDFHLSLYDNIYRYLCNRDIWQEDDIILWNSLDIQDINIGPERKKLNVLFNHIKIKIIKSRDNLNLY